MSDNIPLPNTQLIAASDEIAGVQYQRVKLTLGADGVNEGDVSSTNPIPVSGTVTVSNPTAAGLTDTQLRATPVTVSGTFWQATQPVSGNITVTNFVAGLTDAQLRATPVPVSGTVTANTGLSQPVTDAQLRATPVPVNGTVELGATSLAALENTTVTVSNPTAQGLTDTQLRATPVPVSLASVPSHAVTNAGTFAVQVTSAPTTAVTGTFWQATQPVSGTMAVSNMVAQGLTDTQLRATPVPVSGTITVSNPTAAGLTDAQLRATPVPVNGTVELGTTSLTALENINVTVSNSATEITNDVGNPIPVSGTVTVSNPTAQGLTDAQLRATPVPVSGTVTANTGLTQPLTDTQLRATPVPVSFASVPSHAVTNAGTFAVQVTSAPTTAVTGTFFQATQPVSAVSLPLPTGAATETTLAAVSAKLPPLSSGRIPVELPSGAGGLTDAELRATPVPVSGTFTATATTDDTANMISLLRALVHPIWEEVNTGRLRVVLDGAGGAQTLGTVSTVTTVNTVNNQANLGGFLTNSMVFDSMHSAWANTVRRAIS